MRCCLAALLLAGGCSLIVGGDDQGGNDADAGIDADVVDQPDARPSSPFPPDGVAIAIVDVVAGDIDNDGADEIVLASNPPAGGDFALFVVEAGASPATVELSQQVDTNYEPAVIAVADLVGDATLDVAAGDTVSSLHVTDLRTQAVVSKPMMDRGPVRAIVVGDFAQSPSPPLDVALAVSGSPAAARRSRSVFFE